MTTSAWLSIFEQRRPLVLDTKLLVAGVRERRTNPAIGTAARQHSRARVSIIGVASLPWAWRELKARNSPYPRLTSDVAGPTLLTPIFFYIIY